MSDAYQTVCVWVVTSAGSLVVVAFAVYFLVVIGRLVRETLHPQERLSPRQKPATEPVWSAPRCGCGGELGEIERVDATDHGVFEVRNCLRCKWSCRIPHLSDAPAPRQ